MDKQLTTREVVMVYNFITENKDKLYRVGFQPARSMVLEGTGIPVSIARVRTIAQEAGVDINSRPRRELRDEKQKSNAHKKAIAHITKELLGLLDELGKKPSRELLSVHDYFVCHRANADRIPAPAGSSQSWDVAGGADR